MGRIRVLDVLRGLAAIMVVFFHYSKFWDQNSFLFSIFKYGYTGVILFFMISGFVIFLSINKISSSKVFLFKRFTRLYPTFWVCLLLTSLIVRVVGLKDREVGWIDTVFNITMIPKVFGYKAVDGVYWTLSYEFFFYLLMAVLLKFNVIKNVLGWIIPWLLLCIIHNCIFEFPKSIAFILNLTYGFYFIAGILFYEIKTRSNDIYIHFLILVCLSLSIYTSKDLGEGYFFLSYFILFYLFCFDKINWLSNKNLAFFGSISYPLYLLHQNIGYIIILKIKLYFSEIYFILIPFLLSVLIAFLVYRYFELPVMRRLKKLN